MSPPKWTSSTPQGLIFDLDGTLIDTERHNLKVWIEVGLGLGYTLEEEFYRTLVGRTKADSDARIQQYFGPACPVEDWRAARRKRFYELWDAGDGPGWKPGLDDVLAVLEERALPRAVATSSLSFEAVDKLQRSGLSDHFPLCICGDQVPAGKPAPDLFVRAAELLGLPAHECLAVEDSPLGVEAALAAGMSVVFIPDMVPPDDWVKANALAVLEDLRGLLRFV